MARIPRRFSAAVSQVQDKLGGFSERFSATKKPQSAAESGAGDSAPQSSRTSEGGANPLLLNCGEIQPRPSKLPPSSRRFWPRSAARPNR